MAVWECLTKYFSSDDQCHGHHSLFLSSAVSAVQCSVEITDSTVIIAQYKTLPKKEKGVKYKTWSYILYIYHANN